MEKLPDYADYVKEVGQRHATEHAGKMVWQMLEEEVAHYCYLQILAGQISAYLTQSTEHSYPSVPRTMCLAKRPPPGRMMEKGRPDLLVETPLRPLSLVRQHQVMSLTTPAQT